jgi:hypothetical protein
MLNENNPAPVILGALGSVSGVKSNVHLDYRASAPAVVKEGGVHVHVALAHLDTSPVIVVGVEVVVVGVVLVSWAVGEGGVEGAGRDCGERRGGADVGARGCDQGKLFGRPEGG